MKFSVIIPAYNEAQYIEKAINALKRQSIKRSDFEIIVIDNNSEDNTGEIAKNAGADKVLKELTKGTNIARQRGVVESQGEIVAFLDADAEPPINWLELIESYLNNKSIAAISGPYDFQFKGWKRIADIIYTHFIFSHLDKITFLLTRRRVGVIMGGNFATHRSTLEAIGGLPPLKFYGDDTAIAILITRKVGRVVFNPKLNVVSSTRRFEREGLLRVTSKYAWHYFKMLIFTDLDALSRTANSSDKH